MAAISGTTVAAAQSALVAATAAVASGDYRDAWLEIFNAEAALCGLPLTSVNEGTTAQLRASLSSLRDALREAQKHSAGAHFEKRSRHHA